MSCAVVEGAEVCGAEGVVLEFFAFVEVAVVCDVAVAECQAEGIVVRALQDRAAAADYRPYVAQVVGDVVLRRIGSYRGVARHMAVYKTYPSYPSKSNMIHNNMHNVGHSKPFLECKV